MRYMYWTLRYLPDAVRGEFVNIGLIAGRDGADWAIRSVSSFNRTSRLGGDLSVARRWITSLKQDVNHSDVGQLAYAGIGMNEQRLERMRALHNNSVQLSDPLPVIANSAREAVDLLFERLVVEPEPRSRSNSYQRAVENLRNAYGTYRADLNLMHKVKVQSGRQAMDFDFALQGQQIEQLSRVWAFDLKDLDTQIEKIQAWGFRIEELRAHGGDIFETDRVIHVEPDVPVKVLYVPPKTSSANESLEVARDAWDRINARVFPLSQVGALVAS